MVVTNVLNSSKFRVPFLSFFMEQWHAALWHNYMGNSLTSNIAINDLQASMENTEADIPAQHCCWYIKNTYCAK
jgi:hypothetical protein